MLKSAEENMKWLIEHYDNLRSKYGDQWVAVKEGKVLASNSDYARLLKILEEMESEAQISRIAVDFISVNPPNFLL